MKKDILHAKQPLVVNPRLAGRIGLNEAIVLQQLDYWLRRTRHMREGKPWIYNTCHDWCKQFPFWSERTVKRVIGRLKRLGVVQTANFNRSLFDKTAWYTIDYQALATVAGFQGQEGHLQGDNLTLPEGDSLTQPIPEINPDTTQDDFAAFWRIYPRPRNKTAAKNAWNKRLAEGIAPQSLIRAASWYAEETKARATCANFIMYPARFLGPERIFEEYLQPEQPDALQDFL